MARLTRYQLAFDRSFFFPDIGLDDILEMEFQLSLHLHIPYFNHLEFFEVEKKFARLQEHFKMIQEKTSKKNVADGSRF